MRNTKTPGCSGAAAVRLTSKSSAKKCFAISYAPRFLLFLGLLFLSSCVSPFFFPRYSLQYIRHNDLPEDEALMAIAEAVCPRYEDVAAVFEGTAPGASDECLWWYKDGNGLRYPYAITADALRYYEDLVLDAREHLHWVSISVDYEASVEYLASGNPGVFDDGTAAVSMRLHLYVRKPGLALSLTHERVVLIDASNTVVAVFGDGLPRIPVF